MKNRNMFMIIAIVIFGFLCSLAHEFVHEEIYESYDIDGEVTIFEFFPEENCPTNECKLANSINDVVLYNLAPFLLLVIFGFYFVIKSLEEKNE